MMKVVDYYKFLNIEMDATEEEITNACRKLKKDNSLVGIAIDSLEFKKRKTNRIVASKIYQVLVKSGNRQKYDEGLKRHRQEIARKQKYINAYQEDIEPKYSEKNPADDYSAVWQTALQSRKKQAQEQAVTNTLAAQVKSDRELESSNKKEELEKQAVSKPKIDTEFSSTESKCLASEQKPVLNSQKQNADKENLTTATVSREKTSKTDAQSELDTNKNEKCCKETLPAFTKFLQISDAFVNELLKLRVHKNDNFRKYVLRNKKVLGTLAVVVALGATASTINSNNNSVAVFENTQTTIDSEDDVVNENQLSLDYTTSSTEETTPPDQVTIYRVHEVVVGDALYKFSADSNSTIEEIKKVNGMSSDSIVLGREYKIPYIINYEDLGIYTNSATYDPNMSLEDFAKKYETDIETIRKINQEAITFAPGKGYSVNTDILLVPDFITKDEYKVLKAAERIKAKDKINN